MARKVTIFTKLKWRLEWLIYHLYEASIRILPIGVATGLGHALGTLSWYVAPKRRQMVERSVRIAFGRDLNAEQRQQMAKEVIQRSGSNLLASVKTAALSDEGVRDCVEIEGLEHYQAAKAKDKGVIIVLAHTGNWEVMAQLGALLDKEGPLAAFYRPLDNPYIDAIMAKRRANRGAELFAKFSDISAITAFLRKKGTLGVLCDQRAGNHGHLVPFFNRMTSFTPLPILLARRTKAAIVSASVETSGVGRWKIIVDPEIPMTPAANAADIARRIEAMVRRSPADFFWLQERWRVSRSAPFRIKGKPGLLQPVHHPAQELFPREVVIIGEFEVPEEQDEIKIHHLEPAPLNEIQRAIDELDLASPAGIEFVVGPRELVEKLDVAGRRYDLSLKQIGS